MAQRQQILIAALHDVATADDALAVCLEANRNLSERAVTMLMETDDLPSTLHELRVRESEEAVNAAMTTLFDARHHLRRVVVGAALERGISVQELATMFSVSPDLIRAYAHEQSHRE